MLEHFLAHSHAGVCHGKQHIPSGGRVLGWARVLVHVHVARFQDNPAAGWHGIAGIDYQIHEYLHHLPVIGHHQTQVRIERGDDSDLFPDQPSQHIAALRHHLIEVQRLSFRHLFAAECQQLLRERAGALTGGANFFNFLAHQACLHVRQKHVAVAGDYRQVIVEVVRHSARQAAQTLHLLDLQKLLFQPVLLRFRLFPLPDIAQKHQRRGLPVIFDRRGRNFHRERGSIHSQKNSLRGRRQRPASN